MKTKEMESRPDWCPLEKVEPCEDAVSRKDVVKFLDDWMSALDANCHHQSMADLKIIKNDFENLPSVTPKAEQRWNPCDVRMPEEYDSIFAKFKGTDRWQKIMWEKQSKKVLVTVEYEDGTRAVEVANTFDGKWKYKTAVVERYPVAWCHFPEPFQEEGGE